MHPLLKSYSSYLKIERNMSPNTVSAYISDVQKILSADNSDPLSVTGEEILSYLGNASGDWSKRSQSRFLSSLRSFFDYLVLEGERKDNPCDRVDSPKLGTYLPSVLSIAEVDAIISSADISTSKGVRDRAMLEMLYGCGLRVSELCSVKLSDVYLKEGFLKVFGKGGKERLVPMGEACIEAFSNWMGLRGPVDSDYVFLNRFGKPLSRMYVFKMVKDRALAAGVRKEISPHTFRHSFATHLIGNGADLKIVQEMLGHESILTTEIYTHIDSATWQSAILEHHPRH